MVPRVGAVGSCKKRRGRLAAVGGNKSEVRILQEEDSERQLRQQVVCLTNTRTQV